MSTLLALEHLNQYDIILASKSPRRQQLMKGAGLKFRTINHIDSDEVFPSVLKREEIPIYIARAKAMSYSVTY